MFTQTAISEIIRKQREYFSSGKTKDINFRIAQLKKLKQALVENFEIIAQALKADLNKPQFEAYLTELIVTKEIDYALKHIKSWTQPKKVKLSLEQFPGYGSIHAEPLGVVLIIGAWNYPLQLIISPLVGAIAAGNCVTLKPSENAPYTSHVLAKIIGQYFDESYLALVEGDKQISQQLLEEKWDRIFFTGSTAIGKIVMAAAAKNLTPVTLELGGKSPCIVDTDIDIEVTARRIVWGKFLNAGQTCIAPDYLLVNQAIKQELLVAIAKYIKEFFGDNPETSPDYARIIDDKQFTRLTNLLKGEIVMGGETNAAERYIAPTVIDNVSLDDPVMQTEIFGAILPIIAYDNLASAIAIINNQPKPLAIYIFSRNKTLQQQVCNQTSSGGICINDTLMQFGVSTLPFGGVGDSGIGSYHGKASFDTFSHHKSILNKSFRLDFKLRYPPYQGKLALLKKILF
ncbi:aldehyde dehydrogenase [Synechocystis sp. PCC 7509]|uniref:aldehyde dehydrogenase n=1 Tax=Synechocystis sp. PCC 7509 TaxID=927677 RepID=UPI0002ACFA53|nr:aldehyde dehydrogenase [Synechocystis sp. PCC 7509]